MITELLLLTIACLALVLLVVFANTAISSKIAWNKFKKQLPNVPFLDKQRAWFSNNLEALALEQNCQRMHGLHMELGDTIAGMIGETPALSTVDLDLIKQVCLDNASVNVNRLKFKIPMKEWENDCILFAEDDQWRSIRRSFAPAFKPHSIKTPNVVESIESSIDKLTEGIELKLGRCEDPVQFDLGEMMNRFSLSAITSCFYKQKNLVNFDLTQQDDWSALIEFGAREVQDNRVFRLGLVVPALRHAIDFIVYNFHPIGRWRRNVNDFVKRQAQIGFEAREQLRELRGAQTSATGSASIDPNNFLLKDGTKFRRNMIDHIVDQFHAGKLSRQEYFNSAGFLFNAAYKTTADVLLFTLYQLACNQSIQEQLRESIRKDGTDSKYLTWVLNESLRLNSPVAGGASRQIKQEVKLKQGDTLPKGTLFFTPLYTLHRLPKYWGPDAGEFKPERWARAAEFHPAQYMPFGAGLRICLGKDFADFLMRMLICTLLDRYRFECDKPNGDIYEHDSPLMMFMLHRSRFYVNLSRLEKAK